MNQLKPYNYYLHKRHFRGMFLFNVNVNASLKFLEHSKVSWRELRHLGTQRVLKGYFGTRTLRRHLSTWALGGVSQGTQVLGYSSTQGTHALGHQGTRDTQFSRLRSKQINVNCNANLKMVFSKTINALGKYSTNFRVIDFLNGKSFS